MKVQTGLDQIEAVIKTEKNANFGLLAHPASVNSHLQHASQLLFELVGANYKTSFGPQHGWVGNDQDNMIEWEGEGKGKHTNNGIRLHSLYGKHRKPTSEMLDDIDVLLVDLQDVGTRVYTFIQTLFLVLQAASENNKRVIVLDRPNVIGNKVEGPFLHKEFSSFVGLTALLLRHGHTIGELALYFATLVDVDIKVVKMLNYKSSYTFEQTQLPWVYPSPNMPTPNTAMVYPGTVLIEATSISEGRGTTLPFEIVGSPTLKIKPMLEWLNSQKLAGIIFRPLVFQPTFHKFCNQNCYGFQLHVTDKNKFDAVLCGMILIMGFKQFDPSFAWLPPPYEYETEKMPIDILVGSSFFREHIDSRPETIASWLEQEKKLGDDLEIARLYE